MPSSRNLTGHLDDLSDESADSIQNPFISRDEFTFSQSDNEDYELKLFTDQSQNNSASSFDDSNTSRLLLDKSQTQTRSSLLPKDDYNRYPSYGDHMSRSIISSRQSLLHDSSKPISGSSLLLFDADLDMSPFGGYPLSSFPLHIDEKEDDDYMHNPDPMDDLKYDSHRLLYDIKQMDKRSWGGLIGLILLLVGLLLLFILLPVLTYSGVLDKPKTTYHETYTILTDYEYPTLSAVRTSLIDPDTPADAMTRTARDGSLWKLVFSDEFNKEGRTFYEGDDQFWYAADLNYAATQDLEWYDPDAVTTANGSLKLRMDAIKQHDLFYRSGMLHSWNKMCFTQGAFEVSANLPNYGNVSGLWPGVWSLGNLARPGYKATSDGLWPYSYELCDAGITPNQSSPDGISYLPGQRLNSCTCPDDEHPNAGTGRGAPEIDVIEVTLDTSLLVGVVSQSLQVAPFDIWYIPDYRFIEINNKSVSSMNVYTGGPFQQLVSLTTTLNTTWYEKTGGRYQTYAYEYMNDKDSGYIRWFVGDDPTLTMHSYALAPNGNIDWRPISKEPMSMILNLGVSNSWTYIDWNSLEFPATMSVDYVRVYQPNDTVSLTCDPDDYPTSDYIEDHPELYMNVNRTLWEEAGYSTPRNTLIGC